VTYSFRSRPVSIDYVNRRAKRLSKFSTDMKWFIKANGSTSVVELHKVHSVISAAGFSNIVCRIWLSSSNTVEFALTPENVEPIEELENVVER
jgi:hypothetical protein